MVRIDYTILLRKCKHVNLLGVNIELIEWNMYIRGFQTSLYHAQRVTAALRFDGWRTKESQAVYYR